MSEPKATGALAGVKVIDLTRVLGGPYCTQLLGDHGAEVIKIEPPQGDETRGWGPPFLGGTASYFIGVNRNKRGIALDLSVAEGRAVLFRLLETADVLVENFKTGTLERWGMGYTDVLGARYPRLIHCRISGFGDDGPLGGHPGYDAVVQAMSGLMSINGEPEGPPLRIGTPVVDLGTGLNAMIAILLALQERTRSGKGQFVEATLFDTALAFLHPYSANWFLTNAAPKRSGNAHPNISPYDQFPTRTKRIFVAVGNDRQFSRFCREIGRPQLSEDARFGSNADRVKNRRALRQELEAALAEIDGEALSTALLAKGVPCGPILDVPEAINHPHARHREMVIEDGEYRGIGDPVKLSSSPPRLFCAPPGFGSSNREVLAEAGYSSTEIDRLIASGVVVEEIQKTASGD
jgi:crotonobetainyl-CoA:carnitine CoA-transferase CaiB-like acyl-CoA transferase